MCAADTITTFFETVLIVPIMEDVVINRDRCAGPIKRAKASISRVNSNVYYVD